MLYLYADLQRYQFVKAIDNPTQFLLPETFYTGYTLSTGTFALQPSGPRNGLYAVLPILALVLSLSVKSTGVVTNLVENAVFTTVGNCAQMSLTVPEMLPIPAGQTSVPGILAADITTADGTTHIESACNFAVPAYAPPALDTILASYALAAWNYPSRKLSTAAANVPLTDAQQYAAAIWTNSARTLTA